MGDNVYYKTIEDNYNRDIGNLLALAVLFPILNRTIQGLFQKLGLPIDGGLLVYAIIMINMIFMLFKYRKQVLRKFIIVYLMVLLIFCLNYFVFESTRIYYIEYQGYLRRVLLIFIPIAILVTKVHDYKPFFYRMIPISYIGILVGLIGILFDFLPYWDRLTFSIYLLPFSMMLYYHYRRRFKIIDLAMFLIGFILILNYGGRMSLFSIVAYIFLFELLNNLYKNSKLFIINATFITAFLLLLFSLWEYILSKLLLLFQGFNIESRNLEKILNNEVFSFDTRTPIYEYSKLELSELGFGMHGIFGDRVVLKPYGSWIAYSHNIIYELFLSFGFVIGSLIILFIGVKILKGLFKGNIYRKNIILMFSCIVILRLWVSGSFVIEDNFYILLGILLSKNSYTPFLKT